MYEEYCCDFLIFAPQGALRYRDTLYIYWMSLLKVICVTSLVYIHWLYFINVKDYLYMDTEQLIDILVWVIQSNQYLFGAGSFCRTGFIIIRRNRVKRIIISLPFICPCVEVLGSQFITGTTPQIFLKF
jgi:hypothetical protein